MTKNQITLEDINESLATSLERVRAWPEGKKDDHVRVMLAELSDPTLLIPSPCPWCGHPRKVSRQHESTCRSQDDSHEIPTEIMPGLWVGSIMSRPDPRFTAVVTILSPGEMHWAMGAKIANPRGAWHVINHGDHEPGLIAQAPAAWAFIDLAKSTGPVLAHCGAGASRSPTIMAGYLITRMGMTLTETMTKLLCRPQVMHIWPGYLRELASLERGSRS